MSTSMHEVFHWGPNTSAAPKTLSLSVAGSQIDFEGPPSPRRQSQSARNAARNRLSMVIVSNNQGEDLSANRRRFWCLSFCFGVGTGIVPQILRYWYRSPKSVLLISLLCFIIFKNYDWVWWGFGLTFSICPSLLGIFSWVMVLECRTFAFRLHDYLDLFKYD